MLPHLLDILPSGYRYPVATQNGGRCKVGDRYGTGEVIARGGGEGKQEEEEEEGGDHCEGRRESVKKGWGSERVLWLYSTSRRPRSGTNSGR